MTDDQPSPPPPLDGLQVLDFTTNLPGPYATFLLASLGAEVVKIEPPRGDPGRFMEPFFSLVNRGKRSVVLDLRDEASRGPLRALVERSDVLVESFRPGVMERLGCSPEQARAWNERLVYCSISAYGQQGPRAGEPGHDLNLQALAGVCHLERDRKGTPRGSALPVADLSASLVAVSSICAALLARGAEGPGRHLDVAMGDAVLSWASLWGEGVDLAAPLRDAAGDGLLASLSRPVRERLDRAKLYAMPHYGVFRAADDQWIALGVVDERHFWEGLCEALGVSWAARLPLPARVATGPLLRPVIARLIRRHPRAWWLDRLREHGVPATPVLTPPEATEEPQYRSRGLIDALGRVRAPLPGAVDPERPAPRLGEHTEAVLAEVAATP